MNAYVVLRKVSWVVRVLPQDSQTPNQPSFPRWNRKPSCGVHRWSGSPVGRKTEKDRKIRSEGNVSVPAWRENVLLSKKHSLVPNFFLLTWIYNTQWRLKSWPSLPHLIDIKIPSGPMIRSHCMRHPNSRSIVVCEFKFRIGSNIDRGCLWGRNESEWML